MKFKTGDLVTIIDTRGKILNNFPPAIILSGGVGYVINPCDDIHEEQDEIYTILYGGIVDFKVSGEWLVKL